MTGRKNIPIDSGLYSKVKEYIGRMELKTTVRALTEKALADFLKKGK